MSFRACLSAAKGLLEEAAIKLGLRPKEHAIAEPPREELGDLASNLPLLLAAELGLRPQDVAARLVEQAGHHEAIGALEAHPTGYVNVRLNRPWLADRVLRGTLAEEWGRLDLGQGRTVFLEHTSVNPNKAIHLGHARNMVLGDALARILRWTGHRVAVLNYIDDTGVQVADLLVGFFRLGFSEDPGARAFDQYCGDEVYVKVNELYGQRPELLEERRAMLKLLEEQPPGFSDRAQRIIARVVEGNLRTAWRLRCFYDLLNWESHILRTGLWHRVFELLKAKKLVRYAEEGEHRGCWVVDLEGLGERVLVRSDGTTVYEAKDIAYAVWKLGGLEDPFLYIEYAKQPNGQPLWSTSAEGGRRLEAFSRGAELAITLIDVRQRDAQRLVGEVATRLVGGGRQYRHVGYEVVALSRATAERLGLDARGRPFLHMSGRRGEYVNVDPFLDQLKERIRRGILERNEGLAEAEAEEVAERASVAALRYEMLKRDLDSMIVFDMEEALRLEGDTGLYLLYSCARARRILEKAGALGEYREGLAELLKEHEEWRLIKAIARLDLALEQAVASLTPHVLARYSFELTNAFNKFYERLPVLRAEGELRSARLHLVRAYLASMRVAAELLGLPLVERL